MIEVKIDNRAVNQALQDLAYGAENPRPALLAIGEDLVKSTKKRFSESVAPDGTPWKPNTAATLKRKRGNQPLVGEGIMRDQISYAADMRGVTIFSSMIYAATQQFGASKGQFGRNRRNQPIPWGDIPARPFLGISTSDEQMIIHNVSEYLRSLI